MRYVRSFHFEKAAASVLTTCVSTHKIHLKKILIFCILQICVCENNFLFLGSRLGNSLLLRFTEKENTQVVNLDELSEPPEKRVRTDSEEGTEKTDSEKVMDTLNDCMASDVLDIRDPEEFEVYGNEKQASLQITNYVFEVINPPHLILNFK